MMGFRGELGPATGEVVARCGRGAEGTMREDNRVDLMGAARVIREGRE
jgi:hypothetical protein